MEAKWLKVACLADMLKPQRPYECQKETKGVEMVTQKNNHPPQSKKARGGRARQLLKQRYEQGGVYMLCFFLLEIELCTWWTLNKCLLMLKATSEE